MTIEISGIFEMCTDRLNIFHLRLYIYSGILQIRLEIVQDE